MTCACRAEIDSASGVLRSVAKCSKHAVMRRDPATLDEAYYRELGALDPANPPPHVEELTEALGPLPRVWPRKEALEIGAGASHYVKAIRRAGFCYTAIDPSEWAVGWLCDTYNANALWGTIEDVEGQFDLILAAHVLEHLEDAPAGIVRCAELLAPGGELWVIVPDDSDLCNPDHLYFFDQNTLRRCIERAGLTVLKMAMRRRVERENFIYCRAQKPDR